MSAKVRRAGNDALHPYQRLQGLLADMIASMHPGEKLPAEPDLAKQMGVSRATLREAMRAFEGQGIIRRRQGVGTFVVSHKQVIESGLEQLESIETLARKIDLHVEMGDLVINAVEASKSQAEQLCVTQKTPLIKVSRVLRAENRPVAFLIDVLPMDVLTPEDLSAGFTGSVLDLLLTRGIPPLANSVAEVQAVAASPEIARALQIQRGDVLLVFNAQLYAIDGKIVDLSMSYFLPGYFRFHVVRKIGSPRT